MAELTDAQRKKLDLILKVQELSRLGGCLEQLGGSEFIEFIRDTPMLIVRTFNLFRIPSKEYEIAVDVSGIECRVRMRINGQELDGEPSELFKELNSLIARVNKDIQTARTTYFFQIHTW